MPGEEDAIQFIKNSPKGRIVYETGWDVAPNSTWLLISKIQGEEAERKQQLFERALKVSQKDHEAEEKERQRKSTSPTTASALRLRGQSTSPAVKPRPESRSIIRAASGDGTTFQKSKSPKPKSVTFAQTDKLLFYSMSDDDILGHQEIVTEDESLRVSKRGYGILDEEEYDEEATKSFYRASPYDNLLKALAFVEEKRREEVSLRVQRKREELYKFDREWSQRLKDRAQKLKEEMEAKKLEAQKQREIREKEICRELEERRQAELRLIEKQETAEDLLLKMKERLEAQLKSEKAEALVQEQRKKEDEERAIAQAEVTAKQRQEALEIAEKKAREAEILKLEQEQDQVKQNVQENLLQKVVLDTDQGIPNEFSRNILGEDLVRYRKSQKMIEDMKTEFSHISASNPTTKTFYFHASKAIQTPLNSIGNEIQNKMNHFERLLQGGAVAESGGVNFQALDQPKGDIFVINFLANRFVKKSESEITKVGKGDINPLAKVGVHLLLRFPLWSELLQAYFFKYCPFLVPFAFPRGDMPIVEYCHILGLEGVSEGVALQTLLDRISGYCALYAEIVKILEPQKIDPRLEKTEAMQFFSISGTWRILVATMKLEPQLDVTATVIKSLLESLGARLSANYKGQFNKLILFMIQQYLPLMRANCPPGKGGSVIRFEIFLEEKLKKGF